MGFGFTESDVARLLARRSANKPAPKVKAAKKDPQSGRYVATVNALCDARGLPRPTPEVQFHPTRKWRCDFCWIAERVVMEVDGGIFTNGRHTRGSGWIKDAEKRRELAAMGYLLIPVSPDEVAAGAWVDPARRALRSRLEYFGASSSVAKGVGSGRAIATNGATESSTGSDDPD